MAKKLNLQDVIDRCNEIFDNKYDYTNSVFVNTRTPMDINCPIHCKFSMPPKRHLNGQGCPECGKEYARIWRKGNWKHFIENFTKKYCNSFVFPNIENEYENEKSTLTMYCKRCGTKYEVTGNYLLSKRFEGCTNCCYFYGYDSLINLNKTSNEMVYFDGLKDSRTDKVKLICNEHGEYDVSVNTILQGKGRCSRCNGHSRLLTQEEAYTRLYERYSDYITPISPYVKSDIPMQFRCKNGHTFYRDYNTAMCTTLYTPCPHCSKLKISKERTKTIDKFVSDAIKVYGDEKYDFTDSVYINSSSPITIKCNECGRYFTIEANSFLQGHGCPYHNCNSSLMEKEFAKIIQSYGYETLTNTRSVLDNGKEIDIYVPSLKIAFEFDGLYWHSEVNKDKNYHLQKTIDCEKKGIKLYHIFEDEWISKRDTIISYLNSIFNKNLLNINVNVCSVSIVNSNEANKFLSENHIEGNGKYDTSYGLFYNEKLVSIMCFCSLKDKGQYRLDRFCNKLNTKIENAENVLFNFATAKLCPTQIEYYSDRRFPQNDFICNLRFNIVSKTHPRYYYVVGNKRIDKSLLTKRILVENYGCPSNTSKEEFYKTQKWYKIYDCGHIRYKQSFNLVS